MNGLTKKKKIAMTKIIWNRKIDQLEGRKAKVFCKDGKVYIGQGGFACIGDDGYGNDIDGVTFKIENGESIIFSELDIEHLEFLD